MLNTIFATKIGMTQAWTTDGKRLAVTRCVADDNCVLGTQKVQVTDKNASSKAVKQEVSILEIGYGKKKLKNVDKPLRQKLDKSGFSFGVKQTAGVRLSAGQDLENEGLKIGDTVNLSQVLEEGDVVQVQGTTKGRGFAGAMKRHGFHGGPATHGQSDRARAVGSIGAGTSPGRVWKGKKMPGHYGVETKTVSGLVVLRVDEANGEIWLSGPIPGFNSSTVKITKLGSKKNVKLDLDVLGLNQKEVEGENQES